MVIFVTVNECLTVMFCLVCTLYNICHSLLFHYHIAMGHRNFLMQFVLDSSLSSGDDELILAGAYLTHKECQRLKYSTQWRFCA